MSIEAVYTANDTFVVSGEHDTDYQVGQKILLISLAGPEYVVAVVSSAYSADSDTTTVVVTPSDVRPDVYRARLGLTFAASIGLHYHRDINDAGYIPASVFSAEEVVVLRSIPFPVLADANKLIGENATGTGFETKEVLGTENQVIVSVETPGQIVFSMPQDIDTNADVFFHSLDVAELILAESGVLIGNNAAAVSACTAGAGLQLFRSNAANDDYEFASLTAMDELWIMNLILGG
jgi:hypothetical protein